MNQTAFRQRVDACLDDRRDPLDDAQIVAFLDAHPEQLPGFAALCADLRALRAAPSNGVAAPRRRPRTATMLSLTLVAAAVAIAWPLIASDRTAASTDAAGSGEARIVTASLQEQPPLARKAGSYTIRQSLVRNGSTTFETYEHRSQAR